MPLSHLTNREAFRLSGVFLSLVLLLVQGVEAADPYRPSQDDEILEVLPRLAFASQDELTQLRRSLAEAPDDETLAVAVAHRYLQFGNDTGDPRFFGYARAALKPWWNVAAPSAVILQLRAKLHEKDHLYDLALADLLRLTEQQPQNAQALIEIANICRVQGRYADAWQACDTLSTFAHEAQVTLCRVPLQAVTGEAESAYDALAKIASQAREIWPTAVPWICVVQAQIAYSLDDTQAAERHFREGLLSSPNNLQLLRNYADLLIDLGRNAEAVSLLRNHVQDNGVLLRAAIAAKRDGQATLATEWHAQLTSRFEEIRLRGSLPHRRYEARYELELQGNPQRALELALENWEVQRELRDTRNLLEAALAARDPSSVQHVLEFLQQHRTQDEILDGLVHQLEDL